MVHAEAKIFEIFKEALNKPPVLWWFSTGARGGDLTNQVLCGTL
jgi:hypothetical protein